MATYQYVKPDGTLGTIDAGSTQQALSSIKGLAAAGSGVSLVSSPSGATSSTSSIPQLGTPEYTNYLIGQASSLGIPNVQQYQVPTSASQVNPVPSLNMPEPNSYFGSITDAVAGTKGIEELLTQQISGIDQQRKLIEQQMGEARSGVLGAFSSAPSREDLRRQLEESTGFQSSEFYTDQKARITEINSLNEQYNNLVAAKDQQIAQSYDKLASNNFINNQIAQINRNAAPELNRMSANINAKAAALQALQGNFDRAQAYINQAIQDATADTRDRLQAMTTAYDMWGDTLSRLDTQYQRAFDTALQLSQEQYDRDYQLKSQLAELQLQYPNSSININGTLEAAMSAIRNSPTGFTSTSGSSPTTRFTTTQLNKGASNAGLALTAFQSLDPDVQNFYISSSASYLSQISEALKSPDAAQQIQSSNLPASVKQYLLSRVQSTNTTTSGGNFLTNAWNSVTDWLGGKIYDTFYK